MNGTEKVLLVGAAAAVGLLAAARTQKGAAVAIDVVEAAAGALRPRGIRNNNPGNIEFIAAPARAWRGQVGTDGRFGVYDTPANGVRAIGKELTLDASRGIRTVRGLINNWAPPHENNTTAYVEAVASALDVSADQVIDVPRELARLVAAIIRHENGQQPYRFEDLDQWARAA